MNSPADLFTLSLLATGGLYFSMFAYFNGLLGTKRSNMPILWNSEPLLWYMVFVLMIYVVSQLAGTGTATGPGNWYLTGAGNLLIIYIYLIAKFARHTLPQILSWAVISLITIAVLWVVGSIILAVAGGSDTSIEYEDQLRTLLLLMSVILSMNVFWCFLFSFWTAFLKHRRTEPASIERHTIQGTIVPSANSPEFNLAPAASVTLDFGTRHIEDHGYKADLRVNRENTDLEITVEVSNDSQRWLACEIDEQIATDYDVPYMGSPWRYVRITNSSTQDVQIGEVFDLD